MCLQKIGKEKDLQDKKHYNQFYDNDYPKPFANGHAFKTQIVKLDNIIKNQFHCKDY